MPPARSSSGAGPIRNTKFKPPSFKKGSTANTSTKKPRRTAAPSRTKPSASRPSAARGRPRSSTIPSDSDPSASPSSDDNDDDDDAETSAASDPAPATTARPSAPSASAFLADRGAPALPPKLLARLLHDGFEDAGTRLGAEAMAVVGTYFEIFVREALARAAAERRDAPAGGGIGDDFLQVEDLEKLAPQLLLDF